MTKADPSSIRDALDRLDHANNDHWTADGKPAMKAIEAHLGDRSVTRADVDAAHPGFVRVTSEGESDTAPAGNPAALDAVSAFDSVMGQGNGFTAADVTLAAGAADASDFWKQWLKANDPAKLHERPYHMLSREQQARLTVFVAVAKA